MIRSCLILICFLLNHSTLNGQDTFDSKSLNGLVDELKNKYEVYFSFEASLAKQLDSLDILTKDQTLDHLLDITFKKHGIHYLVLDDQFILLRKNKVSEEDGINFINGKCYANNIEESLPYASVYLKKKQHGQFTDEQGNFSVRYHDSDLNDSLIISYIGFKTQSFLVSEINENLHIVLNQKDKVLQEVDVVISNKNHYPSDFQSLNHLDYIRTDQSAFFGGDPMKSLQFLPGIGKDGSISDIRIRGSQGQNTLIIMDEIPVLNIDHYYNIFSNINPLHFTTSELYKNNIPVEYGGKTAGMVKFRSDKKSDNYLSVESNMLSSSLGFNSQINDKLSITGSGRISYVDLFNNSTSEFVIDKFDLATDLITIERIEEPFKPDFKFYDINLNFEYQFSEKHDLSLNTFHSKDDFGYSRTKLREITHPNKTFFVEDTFSNTEKWSNQGFSLIQTLKIGKQWNIKNVAYSSEYENNLNLNRTLFRVNDNANFNERFDANLDNRLSTLGLKSVLNVILSDNESFLMGFEIKKHEAVLKANENEDQFIDSHQEDTDISIFKEYTRHFSSGSRLKLGLRSTYLKLSDAFYLLPNISFIQGADNAISFKSAYSRDVQGVAELGFENRIGQQLEYFVLANSNFYPVSTADKIMTGMTFQKNRFILDIEAYYKWQNDILQLVSLEANGVGLNNNPASGLYDFFIGDARTRGIDVLLNYQTKNWNTAASYTLSKSSQTFEDIYLGLEHLSPTDRRHQFQWMNQYQINNWTFSGSYIFQSGNPYIDLSQLIIDRDITSPADVQAFLPDYHRFDLGVEYGSTWKNNQWSLGFQVLNVFDHQNVKFNHQATNIKRQDQTIGVIIGNESSMLERSYNISFKIKLF